MTATPLTVVETRNTSLGQILVDGQGRTLYLFQHDTGPVQLHRQLRFGWPPVPVSGTPWPRGSTGRRHRRHHRGGGYAQLTYAGHPLYYFAGDDSAGQTRGQAIDEFGAKWYVLNQAGDALSSGQHAGQFHEPRTGGYGY